MNRTLKVGNRELTLESNAGTALFYKRIFRKDIIKIISGMSEDDSIVDMSDLSMELCFVMSKQGEGIGISSMLSLTYDDYVEWVCSFSSDAFMNANVITQVMETWQSNNETTSEVKNA